MFNLLIQALTLLSGLVVNFVIPGLYGLEAFLITCLLTSLRCFLHDRGRTPACIFFKSPSRARFVSRRWIRGCCKGFLTAGYCI